MKRSLIVALMLTLSAFSAERASAQTVSAQGSGTVGGSSDCFTCVPPVVSSGGKGVSFSFSFIGSCPLMGCGSAVTVMGTFNAVDRETNISLAYSGPGVISPQNHTLCVPGVDPCLLTTPDGSTLEGGCFICATDNSSNGRADQIIFSGLAVNGEIAGCAALFCHPMASGNMHID